MTGLGEDRAGPRPGAIVVHHIDEITGKKPYNYAVLATYNAERSRGLVHTAEWDGLMAKEQARFDAEHHPAG